MSLFRANVPLRGGRAEEEKEHEEVEEKEEEEKAIIIHIRMGFLKQKTCTMSTMK